MRNTPHLVSAHEYDDVFDEHDGHHDGAERKYVTGFFSRKQNSYCLKLVQALYQNFTVSKRAYKFHRSIL